ncbi:uncharacterized protein LJ206_016799 isoform 4-T4 [Theristicus caerulescens]
MATLPLPVAERRLGGLPAAGRFAVGFGSPKCTSSSGRKLGANHNIGDIKEFSAYQKNASNVIPSTWEIQNLKLWSLEDPAENKAQDGTVFLSIDHLSYSGKLHRYAMYPLVHFRKYNSSCNLNRPESRGLTREKGAMTFLRSTRSLTTQE